MSALMAHEIDEVSRLLGQLAGKLDALTRQAENNERNAKGRWANVYARFDEQDRVLVETAQANKDTADEVRYLKDIIVTDVKPVTDDVKRWRLMGMGALAVTGIGAASVGAWAWGAVQWLMNLPKPPA